MVFVLMLPLSLPLPMCSAYVVVVVIVDIVLLFYYTTVTYVSAVWDLYVIWSPCVAYVLSLATNILTQILIPIFPHRKQFRSSLLFEPGLFLTSCLICVCACECLCMLITKPKGTTWLSISRYWSERIRIQVLWSQYTVEQFGWIFVGVARLPEIMWTNYVML